MTALIPIHVKFNSMLNIYSDTHQFRNILEKWFPLQGERAHSLNCVVVCMYVNRKEEE